MPLSRKMLFTECELMFLRLLERTKKLSREDMTGNVWKISAATQLLENFFSRMHDEKGIDADVLMQYGREVHQLKVIVDAQHQKTCEEKLAVLDRLPRGFPEVPTIHSSENLVHDSSEFSPLLGNHPAAASYSSSSGLRARSRAVFQADLRKQLLGDREKMKEKVTSEREDELTKELLSLAQSLKRNIKATGDVINEDNKRLVKMQSDTDSNREKLSVEGTRLARHAYSCGFDCFLIFLAMFVFAAFISMVIFIRIFPKPRY